MMAKIVALCDKIMPKILLVFIMVIVTAASYHGFFAKHTFVDSGVRNSFSLIIEEKAHRPFVHRQLLPITTKFVVSNLPDNIKNELENSRFIEKNYIKAKPPIKYHSEYVLLYILCYLAFLSSTFMIALVLMETTGNKVASLLASLIFALIFPLLETGGGYYYDFFEVLFFVLAIYLAIHGRYVSFFMMVPLAELNKEAFLFFIPMLYPFFRKNLSKYKSCLLIAFGIIISGVTYCWIKQQFLGNPGGMVEFQLGNHVRNLFNWYSYVAWEVNYGIITGSQMFLLYIFMVAYIIRQSWNNLSGSWKLHTKIVVTIQWPLYIFFCAPGELRNLSMFYVTFCVMLAFYIKGVLEQCQ